MSREGCRHPDCIYRNHNDPQRSGRCLYMARTGKSRIRGLPETLQDPKRCPRYIPDGKRRKMPKREEREPKAPPEDPAWYKEARVLYDQGMTDREIAERIGISDSKVYHWRHRKEKLPLHPSHHGPDCRCDWDKAMEMHRRGCGDAEIAKEVGCARNTVYRWRMKHDLLPNK